MHFGIPYGVRLCINVDIKSTPPRGVFDAMVIGAAYPTIGILIPVPELDDAVPAQGKAVTGISIPGRSISTRSRLEYVST